MAIAIHSEMIYSIVEHELHGRIIVAKSRIEELTRILSGDVKIVVEKILGVDLLGIEYENPLKNAEDPLQPFLHADFVSEESGSGLVHMAPGHGMDDYHVCLKHGIDILSPVDDSGRFTDGAFPQNHPRLAGMEVLTDGTNEVLEILREGGHVLDVHEYKHKYPYDWRTKLPIIVRLADQWFANVGSLKEDAKSALDQVQFIPPSGRSRLESFVEGRTEWCISRQRAWGVPIPALLNVESKTVILSPDSIDHILDVVKERGIDAWWTDPEDEPAWIPESLRNSSGITYRRMKDTMDVWFDSGTSWTRIDYKKPEGEPIADVYLEGTDQHRGWFQSSLLTYVSHQSTMKKVAPFKTLITHGFTLDQDGRKMSKSLGNVIAPQQIMDGTLLPPMKTKKSKKSKDSSPSAPAFNEMGPDALRFWVASSDYTKDVVIGQPALQAVNASLHKLRISLKLLLGCLEDFDTTTKVPYQSLTKIDQIALLQLGELNKTILENYRTYEFHKAVTALVRYINADFSAFYIQSIKDRLYAGEPKGVDRRAAQTVLLEIYNHLLSFLRPIVPLTVEEAWAYTPANIKEAEIHPLRRLNNSTPPEWLNNGLAAEMPWLMNANEAVKAAQEEARVAGRIGSSLQSSVILNVPYTALDTFMKYADELDALFVVSSVEVVSTTGSALRQIPKYNIEGSDTGPNGQVETWEYTAQFDVQGKSATVHVRPPTGQKCDRCWRYVALEQEPLCQRCDDIIHPEETEKETIEGTKPVEQ
jgi:isoleucyl-tRNA synthetase